MSLDVYLSVNNETVFDRNITHNLNTMAEHAGLYMPMWSPDEIGVTTAEQLSPLLLAGFINLVSDPARFEPFNPANGWGDYDGLVDFTLAYLRACQRYPHATVSVSR